MRHIIPISGKDSCATAIVQMALHPELEYELFFNDIGSELPETYAWLDLVEKKLGKPITRVGKSLEEVIFKHGILPSAHVRFCTRESKIEPMEKYIGKELATIYFGIRADEDRVGYQSMKHNIIPVYPLKENGLDLSAIYSILDKHELRPPKFFWNRLYSIVSAKLDKKHANGFFKLSSSVDVFAKMPPQVFDDLFAWRSRSNCYFCFFQRLYEWVGLLEHHPKLFDRAQEIEESVGNDEQEKPFTWNQGHSLSKIRKNADRILVKRAVQILRFIENRRTDQYLPDMLALTSCGLFCGK